MILLVPAYALAIDRNVAAGPCFLDCQYHETSSMKARDQQSVALSVPLQGKTISQDEA